MRRMRRKNNEMCEFNFQKTAESASKESTMIRKRKEGLMKATHGARIETRTHTITEETSQGSRHQIENERKREREGDR